MKTQGFWPATPEQLADLKEGKIPPAATAVTTATSQKQPEAPPAAASASATLAGANPARREKSSTPTRPASNFVGFGTAVSTWLFSKFPDVRGRASRSEFWWFFLFVLLTISLVVDIEPNLILLALLVGLLSLIAALAGANPARREKSSTPTRPASNSVGFFTALASHARPRWYALFLLLIISFVAGREKSSTPTRPASNFVGFGTAVSTSLFFKCADFRGRASRSEFWWFGLFVLLTISFVAGIEPNLAFLALLVFLLPLIAATVRRLRDASLTPLSLTLLILFGGYFVALAWKSKPLPTGEEKAGSRWVPRNP